MTEPPEVPSDEDLLNLDRELTAKEHERLAAIASRAWNRFTELVDLRAEASYSVAPAAAFIKCVQTHLSHAEREAMIRAEVFSCPVCATLLKDRRSPVASSILLERGRLRALWLDLEQASGAEFDRKLALFRRALGLPQS